MMMMELIDDGSAEEGGERGKPWPRSEPQHTCSESLPGSLTTTLKPQV